MAHEREHQLIGWNAGTVVADPDRGLASSTDVDADPQGSRIESVLDQLFDHRGGALDHLAGGDRIGDLGRKHLDHGVSFARS